MYQQSVKQLESFNMKCLIDLQTRDQSQSFTEIKQVFVKLLSFKEKLWVSLSILFLKNFD